jgi:hypothetical protein
MSRLKMHLRLLRLGGDTYRVVTLRPSTRVGFSTNFYHQTWHIVSSQRGSRLLARLLWGLSFQRQLPSRPSAPTPSCSSPAASPP